MTDDNAVRLNKFLAERLGISRREADDWIAAGKVLVNGGTPVLGARIDKSDEVCYNGSMESLRKTGMTGDFVRSSDGKVIIPSGVDYVYLALNKPVGYVCSRRSQDGVPTVYELLPEGFRELKTVGRLDKDSSGLILLTNDGDFAYRMTHPSFTKTKLYEVELDRGLEPLHQQMIADFGVDLPDGKSQLGLERVDESRKRWRVTMHEGRNRQIRRTFGALGYAVVRLHRVRFGKYKLSGLGEGEFTEIKRA